MPLRLIYNDLFVQLHIQLYIWGPLWVKLHFLLADKHSKSAARYSSGAVVRKKQKNLSARAFRMELCSCSTVLKECFIISLATKRARFSIVLLEKLAMSCILWQLGGTVCPLSGQAQGFGDGVGLLGECFLYVKWVLQARLYSHAHDLHPPFNMDKFTEPDRPWTPCVCVPSVSACYLSVLSVYGWFPEHLNEFSPLSWSPSLIDLSLGFLPAICGIGQARFWCCSPLCFWSLHTTNQHHPLWCVLDPVIQSHLQQVKH